MVHLPDEAVFVIRIRRADGADGGVLGRVFFHLHYVAGALEHGRLVHVLDDDLDGGLVPEGALRVEAGVDVDVFHLDTQTVLPLPFIVQRLQNRQKRHEEEEEEEAPIPLITA